MTADECRRYNLETISLEIADAIGLAEAARQSALRHREAGRRHVADDRDRAAADYTARARRLSQTLDLLASTDVDARDAAWRERQRSAYGVDLAARGAIVASELGAHASTIDRIPVAREAVR